MTKTIRPPEREARELGLQMRAEVRLMPESIDDSARTVELVWSTGASVRRRDPWTGRAYDEVLSLDPAHVDLSRLNSGAPLLNTHGAYDLEDVLGVVEAAWIDTRSGTPVGRARVRFSEREDVAPIWADVRAGIIRNVSVGYAVRTYEITEEEGRIPVWRAVDWQPMELSAVPVGADAAAGFRASSHAQASPTLPCELIRRSVPAAAPPEEKDPPMTDTSSAPDPEAQNETAPSQVAPPAAAAQEPAALEAAPPETRRMTQQPPAERRAPVPDALHPNIPSKAQMREIAETAMREERARIAGIQEAGRKLGVPTEVVSDLVTRGVALPEARAALIDAAAARDVATDTRPHIRMSGQDEVETRRAAVEQALLHRYEPGQHQLTPAAREWRGLSLIEMARSFLEAEGIRVRGMGRDEIATRALHTTSDFPQILASVTNRTLRAAYEAAPRTYQIVARRTSVADFKNVQRLQLGEAPQLEKVNEAGEFKRGTIGEAKESYRVETYGKVVGITRQVLINDDLDAFTRVPALFGTAAATLESDVVWGIFTANAAMADGKTLFHAGHANLAGTGTALDVVNLAKARTAMSRQTGLDGKTLLNIRPAFLVVPSSLELAAEQLLAQNLSPGKPSDVVPTNLRSLTIVSEPRLEPASGAVPWYLVASPAAIDTIEYAFLEGQEGVFMETRMGFDVDGVEIKARLDFGAKAIDWRGLYKNPGVAAA
jgi:phage major head subunit gpT-like protein